MKKIKIFFLFFVFFIIFILQYIFFVYIVKIINLGKILKLKNTLHNIILLSNDIKKEYKGYEINNCSFVISIPSIDINKTFITNKNDYVIITFDKYSVLFILYPSEYSIRRNKTIQFLDVKSMKITDAGIINFYCNINGEILESDFYMNKDINLFPDDFKVF
ncbi:MAG: hypothetical protein N3E50_10050 [Candidatus Goldbacteria bacterium]|nr:hypothetical protein [Candidatus Goldiibacteriota bacterium]